MSETIIFIKKYKPFVLGFCNCGCNIEISIRSTCRNLQKFKHGHHNLELLKFYKGKNHSKYKNGLPKTGNYRRIKRPYHKYAGKYGFVYYHRYLKELDEGRYLDPNEEVHHIDGNTENNDPSNLQILSKAEHASISRKGKKKLAKI